ncbi:MAG: hypothetical protein H0T73_05365 [Ardenticatenales bacterium]|nr:hypothetical protein [Ardenticatenales bacterium]
MMRHRSISLLLALGVTGIWLLLLLPLPLRARARAGTWYVAPGGNNANSCITPEQPCATPNGALNQAGFVAGDSVLVAAGRYTNTQEENAVVWLAQDAHLSGGWDPAFTMQNRETVLDGENEQVVVVVLNGVTATMERFTMGNSGALARVRTCKQQGQCGDPSPYLTFTTPTPLAFHSASFDNQQGGLTGIHNRGVLTLINSEFLGLYGGAGIWNEGTMTVTGSMVSGVYPTGIANYGQLTLQGSGVWGNFGGCAGIGNGGRLTVIESAVIYNDVRSGASGGGICNTGEAVLVNSTVSMNGALGSSSNPEAGRGGGIYNITGTLALYNSTVTDNSAQHGGGIYNTSDGVVTLQNTLLASNNATFFGGEGDDCSGRVHSRGYNLIGVTTDCIIEAGSGDILDRGEGPFFPLIGTTLPYNPLPRPSAAVDGGNPAGCLDHEGRLLTVDQRGVPRQGRCDIGSYEYNEQHDPFFYLFLPIISSQ